MNPKQNKNLWYFYIHTHTCHPLLKTDKENIESSQRKMTHDGGRTTISMTVDSFSKTIETRKKWNSIFKRLKGNIYQLRILYPVKLSSGMKVK